MNRLLFDRAVTNSQCRSQRASSHSNEEEDLVNNLKRLVALNLKHVINLYMPLKKQLSSTDFKKIYIIGDRCQLIIIYVFFPPVLWAMKPTKS